MSSRLSLFTLLAGIVLLLGSCAPALVAIQHHRDVHLAYTHPVTVGSAFKSELFPVDTNHYVRLGVRLRLRTNSLQPAPQSKKTPLYRFPVEYGVFDDQGHPLSHAQRVLAWNHASRTKNDEATGSDTAAVDVEFTLDKFRPRRAHHIYVTVKLEPDTVYKATLQQANLLVYDNVRSYAPTVLLAFLLAAGGILVAALGVILIIAKAASSPAAPASASAPEPDRSARNLAMWCHLSALAGYVIPFGGLIGPLVLWLVNRDRHPFVNDQGKEAVNFRLTMYLFYLISLILCFILLGFLLFALLYVFDLVLIIIAAVQSNSGERFRYPIAIRLIH